MATISAAGSKRGPTVLVTDAREQRPRQGLGRPGTMSRQPTSRLITVDNVLQYASDIPSMQQRFPGVRPTIPRTPSGRPAAPRLAGRLVPPHMPARSTKVSEKLVLLPEADETDIEADEKADYEEDNEAAPERDNEEFMRKTGGRKGKSYAERLPKSRRAEKLARVTAYCTAQAYKLKAMATFLRDQHGARTKLYDDCLYAVFHLPLLPGTDGYRIRSSPVLKNPGGKAVLDEEIERSERRDYTEGYFEEGEGERFSIRGGDEIESPRDGDNRPRSPEEHHHDTNNERENQHHDQHHTQSASPTRPVTNALAFAELFIFSYGVAVFWNFTANQEKDVLADLTFYHPSSPLPAPSSLATRSGDKSNGSLHPRGAPTTTATHPSPTTTSSLVINPLPDSDFETEDFHFEYNPSTPRPRIFNDMITLRSPDHMLKLTISHAIAQSTKLSHFEQAMAQQMASAQHIPRHLALTGTLGLARKDVLRILGALYRTRVAVNLSSPVLDVPGFFWSAEPTLHPLYAAVRAYLEISPRVKVLNERCRVFLDLAEILSDAVADAKMSWLTWVVIWLIGVSILITCSEVFLRFGLLHSRTGTTPPPPPPAAGSPPSFLNYNPGAADDVRWETFTAEGARCICSSPSSAFPLPVSLQISLQVDANTNADLLDLGTAASAPPPLVAEP